MKKIILLIMTMFIITLSGCALFFISGSGNIVEKEYTFDNFTALSAEYGCDVTITKGDVYSITIKTDDNIVPYLDTSVSGNTLNIDLQQGQSYINFTFEAVIVMPDLVSLDLSGGSHGTTTGFENNDNFSADLSGGSIGDFNFSSMGDATFNLSGGSRLVLSVISSSGGATINCSGGSMLDIRNYNADSANVSLSGGSTAYININGNLNYDLSGGSILYYRGNANLNETEISGGSTIKTF